MTVIKPESQISAPETDLLSYVFDHPYLCHPQSAASPADPLLLSARDPTFAGYSLEQIQDISRRLGGGLHQLGARGRPVVLYGEGNINFPLALFGILAAGASCALPAYQPAVGLAFYLKRLEAHVVFCAPESEAEVQAAAHRVGIPHDRVFIVNESLSGSGAVTSALGTCHWSRLLEHPAFDSYQWPRLSPEEAKETVAVFFQTSG